MKNAARGTYWLGIVALGAILMTQPSLAQVAERSGTVHEPPVIAPELTPQGTGPMTGLDQQKLEAYRTQLQSRLQADRQRGIDTLPGSTRAMSNLNGELGRVNGALAGH